MFCSYCGTNNTDANSKFCAGCGAPLPEQPRASQQPQQPVYQQPQQPVYQQPVYQQPQQPVYPQQPMYQPPLVPQNMTWSAFYQRYASAKTRGYVAWTAVICFFTAFISLVIFAALEYELGMMDVVVYALLGVLLLATKNWVFPLVVAIYGGIFTIIGIANDGTPSGVVAIVVSIACMGMLKKLNDAYSEYKRTGVAPQSEI